MSNRQSIRCFEYVNHRFVQDVADYLKSELTS